ncbi:BNR repeat-containing protein [Aquihabitans sp. G128]|nr:BNR repeat-containing protein [Aquihabitans sp. G128]
MTTAPTTTTTLAPKGALAPVEVHPTPGRRLQPGEVGVLAANAGWCWWQSQRAVIAGHTLLVGSVPNPSAAGGATDVSQVLGLDLATGAITSTDLSTNPYRNDDHNSPGLVVDPDGSVTAGWTGHNNDGTLRFASTAPGSPTAWQRAPDVVLPDLPAPARTSYVNLVRSQGLLFAFTRYNGRDRALWSADDGATWTGGWLLTGGPLDPDGTSPVRPYVQFAANPAKDRIDFVASTGHPKDTVRNALFSGYIRDLQVYRTDGTLVGPLATGEGYRPDQLTPIAAPTGPARPDVAAPYDQPDLWGSDLRVDAAGDPVVAYSLRTPDPSPARAGAFAHEYWWARWDGTTWTNRRLGAAGSELFASERDYTGLATLDPTDPYRVVASSDVSPVTGEPLVSRADGKVHWELYEARSTDAGATWTWRAITANSAEDNLRPLLAAGDGTTALVWLRGRYRSWLNWTTRALVVLGPPKTTALR